MERRWNKPLTVRVGMGNNKSIRDLSFPMGVKLIGIRLYSGDEIGGGESYYVRRMQKSLYGNDEWFYFCKGFDIIEESKGFSAKVYDYAFDSAFCLYYGNHDPRGNKIPSGNHRLSTINVSAIIGQNGTGKSTLIDMIIRVINNLSAAIYGEDYIYTSAQHLHYIENVYASLAIYIHDSIKILTVKGDEVYVDTLSREGYEYSQGQDGKYLTYMPSRIRQFILRKGQYSPCEVLAGNDAFQKVGWLVLHNN